MLYIHIIDRQPDDVVLAFLVERIALHFGCAVHTVADDDVAAALRYYIRRVRGIVVVVVCLVGLGLELVFAVVVEYRITEGIRHAIIIVDGVERYLIHLVRVRSVHFHLRFAVTCTLQTVEVLLQLYAYRRTIDTVVGSVVAGR